MARLAAAAALAFTLAGCGGSQPRDSVPTFERADGSVIGFDGKPYVWCGPFEVEEGRTLAVETLYIRHGRFYGDDRYRAWTLEAVLDDIRIGRELELPTRAYVYTEPHGIHLGAWEENAQRELQTVSSEEDSTGTLTFLAAGCDRGDEVEFAVDATLGSELSEEDRISTRGTFRGRVGDPPPDVVAGS